MADLSVRCECGKETIVSEWAIGAPLRCKSCGKPLEPTEKNTRPVEERPQRTPAKPEAELPMSPEARLASRRAQPDPSPYRTAPSASTSKPVPPPIPSLTPEPSAEPPKPVVTNCARCGRSFRGDWDRYHRGGTMVCHICANLGLREEAEETAPAGAVEAPPPPPDYLGVLDHPNLPQDGGTNPADVIARQERIRRYVIVAAFVTLAVGLAVVLSDDTPIPEPDPETIAQAQAKPISRSVAILVGSIMFAFRFANLTLALYLLLRWKDRLPSDFLLINIVYLGVAAMGLQALGLMLLMVPILGFFVWLGLCAYILWDHFDLGVSDLLLLALFLFILEPLTAVVRMFVLGTIGLVVT